METTKLSTKGQIVLPKTLREARSWGPGTEFTLEERADGVLLRPKAQFPPATLEDVAGSLRVSGKPKSLEQMKAAIRREVKKRHERSRH